MSIKSLSIHENEVLFGSDNTPGIVAVEQKDDSRVEIFRRIKGELVREAEEFRPFIWIERFEFLKKFKEPFEITELKGKNFFKYVAGFQSWSSANNAKKFLAKETGENPSSPRAPYFFLNDPVHQYLLWTGKTFFKSLSFDELKRLQLDIETYCEEGFEFSNPHREKDRIISIGLSDNSGWKKLLFGREMPEKEMIEELGKIILERDPDIIEGHNIFRFDLEYIKVRAQINKVKLNWGRDGSEPKSHASRLNIAERTIDYPKWEIYGRHIVDTWILVQYYDIANRDLDGYGLKEVARHFNLARKDRVYIEGKKIAYCYDHEPELLKEYNFDDVAETKGLAEMLSGSYFIQAQVFPYSFQNVIIRGNATKINSLFLREYLRMRHSVPQLPSEARQIEGGYTDIFKEGVIERVIHCDVQSLYPSIMLRFDLKPSNDELDIFLPLLQDIREFRIKAKDAMKAAKSEKEKNYLDALQGTFKILINSFYGYLATSFSNFSDYAMASEITARGREIIKSMIDWLAKNNCEVIEIDTDGIYFVPPENIKSVEDEENLIERLSESLPSGIDAEYDGRYKAMLSYKMKNYALLDYDERVVIKGSGLKSRGLEKFQREFLQEMIRLLLNKRGKEIEQLYKNYLEKIEKHGFPVTMLCKTATLSELPESYQKKVNEKKRNQSAIYELALASGRKYQPGDQISYYVFGKGKKVKVFENSKLILEWDKGKPDENVEYYQEKLKELYEKFRGFIN
ncbi:MAG: DNA polymerase II [Candidatus Schekmanbacteria bacterium RIFCSPLOWO2_02_FULL_38_14]|nr:MAG: DNA polymerase II [Candidatus Schekmanbacteria bacterium RIFCSPLOWO2_02_FULL_38_14]